MSRFWCFFWGFILGMVVILLSGWAVGHTVTKAFRDAAIHAEQK